ncbi:sensor histidine kinase [Romboutsia sp.]|uniref:sensor histidine kinase n=1 Tax=Romboutsia sp. TaxID=1965302 RepID=UPI003F2D3C2A
MKKNRVKRNLKHSIYEKIRFSIKSKMTLSYSVMFILMSAIGTFGIVYLFDKSTDVGEDVHLILITILVVFNIVEAFIIMIFSYRISKKSLRPVDNMIEKVKEISINDLDTRLDVSGVKNELKDLAKTFNTMLDEIQCSIEKQNQFVSDASHELRTPISVIQGYANLLSRWGKDDKEVLEESISAIKDESLSMKKLIESLLFLARGDRNKQIIEKEDFKINELVDEVVKESIMIDKNHNILSTKNEEVTIYGDRNLIKEAIRVFVDNSMKYTAEGGTIKINSFKNNKGVYILIEDNGIGISKEDLPHVFSRFYRSDKSRNKESGGTGLGLSIAKYIVDVHNGNIKVYSKLGEGTIVSIELPQEIKEANY